MLDMALAPCWSVQHRHVRLQRNEEGLEIGTQLLDYLYHATATGQAQLRGGSAMLVALCSAAQRSADALEAAGLPAMALEALSMARALCSGAKALFNGHRSRISSLLSWLLQLSTHTSFSKTWRMMPDWEIIVGLIWAGSQCLTFKNRCPHST